MKNLDFTISISGVSKMVLETINYMILKAFPRFRKPIYYIYGYTLEMYTHIAKWVVRRKSWKGGMQ
jgi:hypothetical protein